MECVARMGPPLEFVELKGYCSVGLWMLLPLLCVRFASKHVAKREHSSTFQELWHEHSLFERAIDALASHVQLFEINICRSKCTVMFESCDQRADTGLFVVLWGDCISQFMALFAFCLSILLSALLIVVPQQKLTKIASVNLDSQSKTEHQSPEWVLDLGNQNFCLDLVCRNHITPCSLIAFFYFLGLRKFNQI